MTRRTITLPTPIDLAATLGPLAHGPDDPSVRVRSDGVWRATWTAGGPATVHYRADGAQVEAEAWGDGADAALEAAPAAVGALDDAESFQPDHPLLERILRDQPGQRIPRTRAVVEALVPAILEQRVTSYEAHRAFGFLVRKFGEPAPGRADLHLPPHPEQLAGLPYYDLHVLGVEKKRADTIRRVAAGARHLEAAVDLPPTEALARLAATPGVGPWTAAQVALVALGDPDAVPIGDLHLPSMVTWALAGEEEGTDDRMLELLAPFAGHRGRVLKLLVSANVTAPRRAPRYAPRDYRDA
jgi:3-methyladenine DNA glycosylase/8-oxoguanine DNA glycosylase